MKRIVLLVILCLMVFFIVSHSWFVVNLGVALLVLGLFGILVYALL